MAVDRGKWILVISIIALYWGSGRGIATGHDFFRPLAESLWQGKLYVEEMRYELHEMVSSEEIRTGIPREPMDGERDKFYVIYPPMPAVFMMPFVAIGGYMANQSLVSSLLALVSIFVAYKVFRELKLGPVQRNWLTSLYALGSMLWYHAIIGSSWYFASVCGLLLLWLAILAVLKGRSGWVTGLLIGAAALCRFPMILSLPFFIYMTKFSQNDWRKISLRILLGVGIIVGLLLLYNFARYGRIDNYGYYLLEHRWYNLANEYAKGSYDLSYLPRHIHAMFLALPERITAWPFISPNMTSMALWFVFPAIFILVAAPWKKKIVVGSLLAILAITPAHLFHGGVGASQFGYRYALDYMPFLLLIIAEAIRTKFSWWQKGLIAASIVVNAWGIWMLV